MAWKNTEIPFDSLSELAYIVVDDVIKSAVQVVTEEQPKEAVAEAKHEVRNITWLTCKEFTTARGLLKIEEYMKTWELHESWLHWTNYVEDEELQYSTRYHYRVRWSIPTCRKPIPQATANVYFVIEISKIKPDLFPSITAFLTSLLLAPSCTASVNAGSICPSLGILGTKTLLFTSGKAGWIQLFDLLESEGQHASLVTCRNKVGTSQRDKGASYAPYFTQSFLSSVILIL